MSSRLRKDTPYLTDHWECEGCGDNHVRVVRVGEVHSLGEGDLECVHPESPTCCLCKPCVEKAFACFGEDGVRVSLRTREHDSIDHSQQGSHAFVFPERRLRRNEIGALRVEIPAGWKAYALDVPRCLAERLAIYSLRVEEGFADLELVNVSDAPLLTVAAICGWPSNEWVGDGEGWAGNGDS